MIPRTKADLSCSIILSFSRFLLLNPCLHGFVKHSPKAGLVECLEPQCEITYISAKGYLLGQDAVTCVAENNFTSEFAVS